MMTKKDNIDEIMKHDHHDIIREILTEMDDFKVSWIRQQFSPMWQDGFWDRNFTRWYKYKAREFFTPSVISSTWKCDLCGSIWDMNDDIFVNHFRYGKCDVLNDIFDTSISEDTFLKKIKELNSDKDKNCKAGC